MAKQIKTPKTQKEWLEKNQECLEIALTQMNDLLKKDFKIDNTDIEDADKIAKGKITSQKAIKELMLSLKENQTALDDINKPKKEVEKQKEKENTADFPTAKHLR